MVKLSVTLFIAAIAIGGSIPAAMAQSVSCSQIGNSTYCSDGTTYNRIGNTTYGSDGTTYNQIGNTIYGSNGARCTKIGMTTYCN